MFDLSGKTALVTGASGGSGRTLRAVCMGGCARGACRHARKCFAGIGDELGEGAEVLVADLSSSDGAVALAGAAETALDGLDILVNNAGITRDNLALRMKDEDWDAVLSVNLTAGFQLIRAALRGMMKRRHGRIIGITSVVGTTGNPGAGKLRGIESRYDRHEQITGAGSCQPAYGQLCGPRFHYHANDGCSARSPARKPCSGHSCRQTGRGQ